MLDPDGLPLRGAAQPGRHAGADLARAARRPGAARPHLAGSRSAASRLLLLDTDIPENDEELRGVTDRLYGGGGEHRLLQELLLGIGGVARRQGAGPSSPGSPAPEVFHTNEGHAGFLGLERISDLIGEGLTFDEALQVVRAGTVFTTHTPGPRRHRPVRRAARRALLLHRPAARASTSSDVLALGAEDYDGRIARRVQHGRHGPAPRPARQRRLEAARRRQPRTCSAGSGRDSTPTTCRSPRSPTACTRRPGPTRMLRRSPSERLGTDGHHARRLGARDGASPTPSSGRARPDARAARAATPAAASPAAWARAEPRRRRAGLVRRPARPRAC